MAKINLFSNPMANFMMCEAIGEERKQFENLQPNEDGSYDIVITLNGVEVNVERFIASLQMSYQKSVVERTDNLLRDKYESIISEIYEIEHALESHKHSVQSTITADNIMQCVGERERPRVTQSDIDAMKAYVEDCMDPVAFGNTDWNHSYSLALECMEAFKIEE